MCHDVYELVGAEASIQPSAHSVHRLFSKGRRGVSTPHQIPVVRSGQKRHSLWLIPAEPAKSSFQDTINRFSSEHGTPAFGPHVTLIAGVKPEGGEAQVVSKAERLALELKAISARVERAACKDLYFQSVFALIAQDQLLLDAHNAARATFGQDAVAVTDYMPHISLLYGDLPMEKRAQIRQSADATVRNKDLVLNSLEVWCTEGVVADWKLVASMPLQKP